MARPAVVTITDELREAHRRITAIVARAQEDDRDLTDAERREVEDLQGKMERLAERRGRAEGFTSILANANGRAINGGLTDPRDLGGEGESLGAQLVRHPAFESFRNALGGESPIGMTPIEIKAAAFIGPPTGIPPTTVAPPAALPLPAWGMLSLSQLFTVLPAEGGNVPYMRDPGTTSAAAKVAEGAAKPETTVAPVLIQDPLAKIAHWTSVSNESLEDIVGFQAWVNSILLTGVFDAEQAYLVTTLLATSGLTGPIDGTGKAAADALLDAAMQVQASSKLPVDGFVVAPDVYLKLATAKASTAGQYLSGLPLSASPIMSLWGLPLVVSASLAAATGLVGSFKRGGAIYRKGAYRLDLSNSHSDFFVKNLVAVRCEVRELLAVYKPKGFASVTNLA
jgi:hypothetical protein